jgi:hypothetical protein
MIGKIIISIIRVALIILLVLDLIIWLMAQGSSHNIPLKTNLIFGAYALILFGVILSLRFFKTKKK